ncbi:protein of unknown function [Taphrina deformans PYCC 5710]|uniref:Transcription initiation factor TFIID subunit 1 histone acetyltransferase domain-containing protein n=1 Tax=Taphrina deformans (strain PYCC 5710 / ATCC 11124 / CBS 356.35 / IMI 108563 / JCM 9778 / NBRC 8474) TaxID=1097556 RepID=R4XKJ4_TAPDE|nr:protein of unknown function [Taphrina deformans PYCC 5710]|eukprot:CCG84974.1 protein of unknown function [Taphrina deformans PYCC 5710]
MEADEDIDLFGDADDTDHFFLPEHYVQHDTHATDEINPFDLVNQQVAEGGGPSKVLENIENGSLVSDGLSDDEELPEEEEPTNPTEEVNYEDLIAQAQQNVDKGSGDQGDDVHLPDFGGLPAGASGAMARWMAGVEQTDGTGDDVEDLDSFEDAMSREEILREYYPSFKRDQVLDFSDLFAVRPLKHSGKPDRKIRQVVPNKIQLEVEPASENLFKSSVRRKRNSQARRSGIIEVNSLESIVKRTRGNEADQINHNLDENDIDMIIACKPWDVLSDDSEEQNGYSKTVEMPKLHFFTNNHHLWMNDDIYDGTILADSVMLDMNDPRLYLTNDVSKAKQISVKKSQQPQRRYNFSNDEAYALLQATHQSRVRSNLTQLSLEHAGFSDRLQTPYYKTILSKSEARAYHRPTMVFKPNQEVRFSRVRPRKKKDKDRTKDPKILLKTTKDISLSDNSGFVCLEYSEEYPTILSNVGMSSKIVNYYRKRSEEDEARPNATYGEPSILGPNDRSPFWNFGSVEPGETVQTVYNKLYRAPIFRHAPPKTDFLLVRSSTKLGNRFYLRNLKHVFVVGQTLPVIDIPGPHSRKVTTSYKNRLKMITYRLIRKSENQRLLVKDLIKHFPDQNELQIRQRLKDFMEFQRKGEDQNFWKLKAGDILPGEEATRSMIDPETVCLIESMQVGQRHLEDSGYGKSTEVEDEQEENMTTEQKLAPWIATRNFINATQGKAMLQLYGEGDPTGRGEGVSFIRTSMKGGFKVAGESVNDTLENEKPVPKGAHAYNVAKQQRAYEDEIARIWKAQKTSLSMTNDQVLDTEALENNGGEFEADSPFDIAPSPSAASDHDDDMMSMTSGMSASNLNKVLKIQRVSKDSNGNLVTSTEVVRDSHVIHAYIQKRRIMEEEDMDVDGGAIEKSTDEEKNKRVKKKLEDELARLKRNAERRRIRKMQKDAGLIKSKPKKQKVEQ